MCYDVLASLFSRGFDGGAVPGNRAFRKGKEEEPAMLMAIDVGNTNMVFGLLEGETLVGSFR